MLVLVTCNSDHVMLCYYVEQVPSVFIWKVNVGTGYLDWVCSPRGGGFMLHSWLGPVVLI